MLLMLATLVRNVASFRPVELRVSHLRSEHALGIVTPHFSWEFPTVAHEPTISALQIMLSNKEANTLLTPGTENRAHRWSMESPHHFTYNAVVGTTREAMSVVEYDGDGLQSSSMYYWRVCLLANGAWSCSEVNTFVTGIVATDWKAKWIGGRSKVYPTPCRHCMASYHAWCAKNEKGPICGFQGVQLRSPEIKLPGAKVTSATIHVTAMGFFELYLNGRRVGDALLEPGFSTNYTERLLYSTYDVTELLQQVQDSGRNGTAATSLVLAARVGAGKYSLGDGGNDNNSPPWALLAELHITLDSELERVAGAVESTATAMNLTLVTDGAWTVSPSPILSENLYVGEIYDAREEQPGWNDLSFVSSAGRQWLPASEIGLPTAGSAPVTFAKLAPMLLPPMRVRAEVTPVAVHRQQQQQQQQPPDLGTVAANNVSYIFDLGNNYAGLARIALRPGGVTAAAGARVTLTFGEQYDGGGGGGGATLGNGFGQSDTYIYSGKEKVGDTWAPSFVYHGFRYVRVDYPTAAEMPDPRCDLPNATCVVGLFIHSDVKPAGQLHMGTATTIAAAATAAATTITTTTADVLNTIHKSVVHTQEAVLNFGMQAFYSNWVQTMADMQDMGCTPTNEQFSQEPPYGTCCSPTLDPVVRVHPTIFQCSPQSNVSDTRGSIPDVVPLLWGNGGGRGWPGSPVWAAAFVVIPDLLLSHYHDTAFVKRLYPHLKRYVAFLERQANAFGHGLPQFGLLGDWCPYADPLCPGGNDACLKTPGWTSGNPTSAFYYIMHLSSMQAMAESLGAEGKDDAARYAAMLPAARAAYHQIFFDASTGSYGRARSQQTANILPLALNMVPPEHVASVIDALLASLYQAGGGAAAKMPAFTGGGVGARWVLQALCAPAVNRTDVALALASRILQPSWGYMATNPPGTLWENWNKGGSNNHIMMGGGIDPWFYHHVGGVRVPGTITSAISPEALDPYTKTSTRLGVGEGVRVVPAFTLELGVDEAVVVTVGGCATTLKVHGGEVVFSWRFQPGQPEESSPPAPQQLQLEVSVPAGYIASLSFPRSIGGTPAMRVTRSPDAGAGCDGGCALHAGNHSLCVTY